MCLSTVDKEPVVTEGFGWVAAVVHRQMRILPENEIVLEYC
jgi:hypothetical protein